MGCVNESERVIDPGSSSSMQMHDTCQAALSQFRTRHCLQQELVTGREAQMRSINQKFELIHLQSLVIVTDIDITLAVTMALETDLSLE